MNDTDLKALNAKLLKFAGFTDIKDAKFAPVWHSAKFPDDSDLKDFHAPSPNLVEDANHQIKWIYHKLLALGCCLKYKKDFSIPQQPHQWTISGDGYRYDGVDLDSPTLAFVIAVEKYIDYIEKKNGR